MPGGKGVNAMETSRTRTNSAKAGPGGFGQPPFGFDLDNPLLAHLRTITPASLMPTNFLKASSELFLNVVDVATGVSTIAPDKKDARFKDPTWENNPHYKRLAQAYLAMTDAMEKMIPDDLAPEARQRAEIAATIVASALSPTNSLLGNPAALSRTLQTNGANLTKGYQNFVHDLQHNGGLPAQVDDSGFEVGSNLAVTPGEIVMRTELFELIHYKPATAKVWEIPALLIPPQIGRYYFTDLAPGRSFAEYVVSQGLQYFALVWRNPRQADADWGLETYLAAAIEAVEAVCEITGQPKVNVIGFCAGGMLTGMMAAYLKAKGVERINSITLCVTMLDYTSDAAVGAFRFPALLSVAKAQSEAKGILPGSELHKLFSWLRPNDLIWNYWVNNYLMGEDPPAFDILAWNKDGTNLPAQLHSDFLELFETNDLVEPGVVRLLDEPIDLGRIDHDAFVVGAITDHLTPWKACYRTAQHLSGEVTFALSNGGHIAALVNPPGNPKAFHWLAAGVDGEVDGWHERAPRLTGSWWESWTKWCAARGGDEIAAPKKLGSKRHRPLGPAPGLYVREPSDRA
jgi:polyhydroxyalkanoate synthase subunit PhaC